ncbi:putative polysaccharide biosynthesis protein [Halonatronum saccharophilum]|uniref:putative polysaccharide biosynthesis protein n=1 Tax=Halonatronum saccharophilum TaxID=150060 RepID=UPI000485263C|nr:polysaccharide biosynthesis protein [Halonatronum saccharophilum]
MTKEKNTLLQGTMILTSAALISKFLGFFYKAILARLIGSEGLGIYEQAYPIYTMVLAISIAGIPVAISKLISAKRAEDKPYLADHIFRTTLKLSFSIGLIGSIGVGLLARFLALYIWQDISVYYSILAISPAIFIVSIMAAYRGYFQGCQKMEPTAISQVLEQFIRIVAMLILAYLLIPYGVEFGAAGAAAGAFFGSIGGLIVMLIIYRRFKRRSKALKEGAKRVDEEQLPDIKKVFREVSALAVPVTISAMILPLMRLIDSFMVANRLQVAGFSLGEARALFGQFSGMAMTLVRFPTVLAGSLAVSLVPAISEAASLGEDKLVRARIRKAIKLVLYITIPAFVGLFILAEPLTGVIFDHPEAAIPLRYLAVGVIAVSLQQVTSSILQGFGKAKLPARNLLIGVMVNVVLNYTLTANPILGIRGAAIGTTTGFSLAAALNIINVFQITKPKFDNYNLLVKPIFSSLVMAFVVCLSYRGVLALLGIRSIATLVAVGIGMLAYGLALLSSGAIVEEDLRIVPKIGEKMANILAKLGFVRG